MWWHLQFLDCNWHLFFLTRSPLGVDSMSEILSISSVILSSWHPHSVLSVSSARGTASVLSGEEWARRRSKVTLRLLRPQLSALPCPSSHASTSARRPAASAGLWVSWPSAAYAHTFTPVGKSLQGFLNRSLALSDFRPTGALSCIFPWKLPFFSFFLSDLSVPFWWWHTRPFPPLPFWTLLCSVAHVKLVQSSLKPLTCLWSWSRSFSAPCQGAFSQNLGVFDPFSFFLIVSASMTKSKIVLLLSHFSLSVW